MNKESLLFLFMTAFLLFANTTSYAVDSTGTIKKLDTLYLNALQNYYDGKYDSSLIKTRTGIKISDDKNIEDNRFNSLKWRIERERKYTDIFDFLLSNITEYSKISTSVIMILPIYLIFLLTRKIYTKRKEKKKKFLIPKIGDEDAIKIKDLPLLYLIKWNERNSINRSNLFLVDAVNNASETTYKFLEKNVDLNTDILSDAGSLKIGSIIKLLKLIPNWFKAYHPKVIAEEIEFGNKKGIYLMYYKQNNLVNKIVDYYEKNDSEEKIKEITESMGFKMYCYIANKSNTEEAEAMDDIRKGLAMLEKNQSGKKNTNTQYSYLEEAHRLFVSARCKCPHIAIASLYEGIVLDLLERHEEAIHIFSIIQNTEIDSAFCRKDNTEKLKEINELKEKAAYSEAISRLRRFSHTEYDRIENILNKLTVREPEMNPSRLELFAEAARANLEANKIIFWQEILCKKNKTNDETELSERKNLCKHDVEAWTKNVKKICNKLSKIASGVNCSAYNEEFIRQLKWAVNNALGNASLNYAIYFVIGYPDRLFNDEKVKKESRPFIDEALARFEENEFFIGTGVETATNIATAMLFLGNYDRCRAYCNTAQEINDMFEYAYLREAESYDFEKNTAGVKKVFMKFFNEPKIKEFIELKNKYS